MRVKGSRNELIREDFCALRQSWETLNCTLNRLEQMLRWTAEDAADESYMWRTRGATEEGRGLSF